MSSFLSVREVSERTGLSRTTIWRMERDGRFPAHRNISARRIGWLEAEVDQWVASRKPERSIKLLSAAEEAKP